MSEPIDQLKTDPPRTGRLIREDGIVINEADAFDRITDSLISIAVLHANTHRGIVFTLTSKIELAASQIIYFVGITKENVIHFNQHSFSASEGDIDIFLLEDVTYTEDTGSPLVGKNRNRLSPRDSTLEIFGGGTVTDDGLELNLLGFPKAGAATPTRIAQSAADEEWVLKRDSVYAFKMVNNEATAKTLYGRMTWYEPGLLT